MDLTEAKRFVECEKRVGGVHPHPGMVLGLVTEIERLQKEVRRWQLRQRIGWYNPDTKRFCYSDVKDEYPDSHASYSIPVFIEAVKAAKEG